MDSSDYTIRPAEFSDASGVFDLIKSHPQELLPRAVGDIVQNIDRFLVAQVGDATVGVVSWRILPEIGMTSSDHSVEIASLAVADGYQGKGIGSALVDAAIQRIRPLNTTQIVVLTFTPEYFRKLGFKEIPKTQLMHKIYAGCINCTKYDSPFTCPEVAMVLSMTESGAGTA
jgi:amino-acid N-acetyltransferase